MNGYNCGFVKCRVWFWMVILCALQGLVLDANVVMGGEDKLLNVDVSE